MSWKGWLKIYILWVCKFLLTLFTFDEFLWVKQAEEHWSNVIQFMKAGFYVNILNTSKVEYFASKNVKMHLEFAFILAPEAGKNQNEFLSIHWSPWNQVYYHPLIFMPLCLFPERHFPRMSFIDTLGFAMEALAADAKSTTS